MTRWRAPRQARVCFDLDSTPRSAYIAGFIVFLFLVFLVFLLFLLFFLLNARGLTLRLRLSHCLDV